MRKLSNFQAVNRVNASSHFLPSWKAAPPSKSLQGINFHQASGASFNEFNVQSEFYFATNFN